MVLIFIADIPKNQHPKHFPQEFILFPAKVVFQYIRLKRGLCRMSVLLNHSRSKIKSVFVSSISSIIACLSSSSLAWASQIIENTTKATLITSISFGLIPFVYF